MRKEQITCMGASAHTIMVGWDYKGVTECVMVPARWYPRGKLHAPPFCHIGINMLYPFPYQRKDQLLMDAGLVRGNDVKRAYWRPAPTELMKAAMLMDSFESVRVGESFGIGAKQMGEQRDGKKSGGGAIDLVTVIARVWQANYIQRGRKARFASIREALQAQQLRDDHHRPALGSGGGGRSREQRRRERGRAARVLHGDGLPDAGRGCGGAG